MKMKKLKELRNQYQQKSLAASNSKINSTGNGLVESSSEPLLPIKNQQGLSPASVLEQGTVSMVLGKGEKGLNSSMEVSFLPSATKKPYTPNNSVSSKLNNNSSDKNLKQSSISSARKSIAPIRKETSLWSQPIESFTHYRVTGAFSEESLQLAMRQGAINKEGLSTLRKVGKIPEKVK